MRPTEIEAWALRVVDSLRRAGNSEDSRVEMKQTWMDDHHKAARRIAGHLNSTGGEDVLWLIGVAESGSVEETSISDFADWWASVRTYFDGPSPSVTEVIVHEGDKTFVALVWGGAQVPYVVRNPAFGKPNGGPIALEVPWREMTQVRSARHSDLIRVLAPRASLPEVEVVSASLELQGIYSPTADGFSRIADGEPCTWRLEAEIYCVPADHRPVVFPAHRTTIELVNAERAGNLPLRVLARSKNDPLLLIGDVDRISYGPGRIPILGSTKVDSHGSTSGPTSARIHVRPAWFAQTLSIQLSFSQAGGSLLNAEVSWSNS